LYLNYEPFQSLILIRMIRGWVCFSYYLPLPHLHKTKINKLIPSCVMCLFYTTKFVAHILAQENIQKSLEPISFWQTKAFQIHEVHVRWCYQLKVVAPNELKWENIFSNIYMLFNFHFQSVTFYPPILYLMLLSMCLCKLLTFQLMIFSNLVFN
jgi:hypothetical protein